jgi:hypothetical protein
MSAAAAARIRATLENELSWRRDEIRNLRNAQISQRAGATTKMRALLVMLYAHLEGFSKFALEQYATTINNEQVPVLKAKKELSAACLAADFRGYRTADPGDQRDPEGSRARQVAKDAELIERILTLQNAVIRLDVDSVTSADSNLSSVVLHRNLTMLGLDRVEFYRFASTMRGLLNYRNNIAHGQTVNVPSDSSFLRLEDRIFDLCESLMRSIYEAVRDEEYLRLESLCINFCRSAMPVRGEAPMLRHKVALTYATTKSSPDASARESTDTPPPPRAMVTRNAWAVNAQAWACHSMESC